MSDLTQAIECKESTWTPIRARNRRTGKVGWYCEHKSEGCRFCYAGTINRRLGTGLDFHPGHRNDVDLYLDEEMLTRPLRWRLPRMIIVCNMSDLFAEFVPDEWIDRVFTVMALAQQHTFQCLTKRPERMWAYVSAVAYESDRATSERFSEHMFPPHPPQGWTGFDWPLPNVWCGCSCEDQETADERIPHLLVTPAAVRFVSFEPLLSPIDLESVVRRCTFDGAIYSDGKPHPLDWVIVGGESGTSARTGHIEHHRWIIRQCSDAGVPVFEKQAGRFMRMSRSDAVQPCALGAGWRSAPGAADGVVEFVNRKGGDPIEWPADLRIREMPA